jgi:type IV secretory pathway VirB10-like protein
MLFGQSVFQSVLTRLKHEQEDEGEQASGEGESFRIHGLGTGFVASTIDEFVDSGTGTEAYFAFLRDEPEDVAEEPAAPTAAEAAEPPAAPEPPEPSPAPPPDAPSVESTPQTAPAHLLRLTQEEISAELAITAGDTEASLAEKRRRFAKANHPDRVAPQYRENAHIRMQTANLLIDQAVKRLAWR